MVQVKQSQVAHLVEDSRRDLSNMVPTKTKLLKTQWEA